MLVLMGIYDYFGGLQRGAPLISSLNGVILKNYDVKGLHETEEACV